jgi:CheY-like chemotaxis protein
MAGERILVVDDDPDFVEAMRLVLEMQDYQVFQAASGREALEKIGATKPDLILLDIMMESETAGFEAAYQLRNPAADAPYAALCAVPILMLTALGQAKQVSFSPGTFLPVDEYLEKPVRPELLLAKIAALLQAGGSRYESVDL